MPGPEALLRNIGYEDRRFPAHKAGYEWGYMVPKSFPGKLWFFGLGTPGLQKTTWPINHYGIPLKKIDDFRSINWLSGAL